MATTETTKKFLNYEGLEHVFGLLKNHGFEDRLGLSQENFTTALKAKYDALVAASSVEDLTALFERVSAVEALIESDSDGAINKFNEIVAFLNGVGDTKTLSGMLADVSTQIADAKKAGTDASSALNAFKPTVYAKTDVDSKVAELNNKLSSKLEASDMVAITNAEIDALIGAAE